MTRTTARLSAAARLRSCSCRGRRGLPRRTAPPRTRSAGCTPARPRGRRGPVGGPRGGGLLNSASFTAWDTLRVAGVAGRDRQVIPDGRLCGGNPPACRGLDLARRDWPATRLGAGRPADDRALRHLPAVPHQARLRPSKPLTWAELPARRFAEVKGPPLTNGAYRIRPTLPADRTGRQVHYTIRENSSTR